MIQLNGVTLDDSLVWENEFDAPAISQNVLRTVMGNAIIQSEMLSEDGHEIVIKAVSSGDDFIGSFTREQIIGFKNLERAGSVVSFVYEEYSTNVVVKSGGVQMSPVFARDDRSNSNLFTGTLTLIKV